MEREFDDNYIDSNHYRLIEENRRVFKNESEFIQLKQSNPCVEFEANLEKFYQHLKDVYFNQITLEILHEKKMFDDDDNNEEKHYDRYNCTCKKCRDKHGSLPLLVDVIEQNEENQQQQQEQEQQQTEEQPSTSQETPARFRKEMKCDHCDKLFTHKGDLNKHLRKHTGEQPFTCTICNRKFAHTSNLTRHIRLHSGSRPFKCDNCDKTFNRKDKLELHRKSKSCKSPLPP